MLSTGIDLTMRTIAPLALAMLTTSLCSRYLIPVLKRAKTTQQIYELAPDSHQAKADTPTMGGLAIMAGVMVGCAFAMALSGFSLDIVITLAVFLLFGAVGFLDDFTKITKRRNLGLTASQKLLFQSLVSCLVALYYIFLSGHDTDILIPFMWKSVNIGYFIIPYIMFIIVAMTNGVNLTDGLDGLASGVTAVISLFWPVVAVVTMGLGYGVISSASDTASILRYTECSFFFISLAGACIGFLVYNRHPALIFMGDTGSLAMGGGIATAALFTKAELILPLVGIIYVLEVLSVIIQVGSYRLRGGKRVFKMAPLHHHFELSGYSEQRVVSIFIAVTLIVCLLVCAVLITQAILTGDPLAGLPSFTSN